MGSPREKQSISTNHYFNKEIIIKGHPSIFKISISSLLLLAAVVYHHPLVWADTPPVASYNGPTVPTGASAGSYTYDSKTGLWENAYYTFNPANGQYTPINPPTYTYNPTTGMWDYPDWTYNPTTGQYEQKTFSVTTPPDGAITSGSPTPVAASSGTPGSNTISGTGDSSTNSIDTNGGSNANNICNTGSSSNNSIDTTNLTNSNNNICNTGSSSNNSIGGSNDNSAAINNLLNAVLNNNLGQNALSGDASVVGNTTAGDATSGAAVDIANLINLLQSAGITTADLATFESNITGNVIGNVVIDPTSLKNALDNLNNLEIKNSSNGQINNNLSLGATSGNATVADNTNSGNATSGAADAVANVVNLINSIIAAQQSFLGVVNIFGNLTGNILVPQQFVNDLLAANGDSQPISQSPSSFDLTNNNNQAVNNNVNATATTGQALVSDNTQAGNATSGAAKTNITLLNLTGQQVVASNSLLVFVNVLGQWIGLIMNAPAGSTAAEFGGGVSPNSILGGAANTTINNNSNEQINNNINLAAASGNANVLGNTTAGNATSGNATDSANIVNILGSNYSLSGWFGILFINVFGTWDGSFGILTPPTSSNTTAGVNDPQDPATGNSNTSNVFSFVPLSDGGNTLANVGLVSNKTSSVLASTIIRGTTPTGPAANNFKNDLSRGYVIGAVGLIIGVSLITVERVVTYRKKRSLLVTKAPK